MSDDCAIVTCVHTIVNETLLRLKKGHTTNGSNILSSLRNGSKLSLMNEDTEQPC